MQKYVVLLRGINVGGKNLLPMKELKSLLEASGFQDVQTYIQSGNIVLLSKADPSLKISQLVEAEFGFAPAIMALSELEFLNAVSSNPYRDQQAKTVHIYFCEREPVLDSAKLQLLVASSEEYELHSRVFYLYAPAGIGRSKLIASIEECLGTTATGRNLNTVNKLASML